MSPTPNAAQNCAEWLKWCRRNGWPKESTSRLCDLWWEFHDDEGNLVGEQPDLERFRETLVGMRSQSDGDCNACEGSGESAVNFPDGTEASTKTPPCAMCGGSGVKSE